MLHPEDVSLALLGLTSLSELDCLCEVSREVYHEVSCEVPHEGLW